MYTESCVYLCVKRAACGVRVLIVRSERTGKVVFGRAGSSESARPSYVWRPTGMKSCDGPMRCAPPQHSGSKDSTRQPLLTIALSKSQVPSRPNE